ncbi:MAG: hypothetical protein KJI69_05490 [Patescibacteria group bacterium]|nr:hypothetical protein [Patescibacteria group bacterium]
MRGFKDSNNKFHPISQSKGVRSRRDKSLKPDGVRLQRVSPFLIEGRIDDNRLKGFWENLSIDERQFAVQQNKTWKNLTKKDKLNLIEFEKNVTEIKPDVKSELVKRGVATVPSLQKVSEKDAEKLLKDYEETERIDKRDFARIKELVQTRFDFQKIKNMLDDTKLYEDSDKSGNYRRYVITGQDYEILELRKPKNALEREQLEDLSDQLTDFLTANLRNKLGDRVYSFRDKDGDIVVAQRFNPSFEEDNDILISKGILRKARD